MIYPKTIWQVTKQTGKEWGEHRPLFVAASIAFYIILSLGPILTLVVLLIGSFMGKANTVHQITFQLQSIMGEKPAKMIEQIVEKASTSPSDFTSILSSIPLLFFGSTMIFFQIRNALNTIWDIEPEEKKGFLNRTKKYSFSFLMLTIIELIFLALVLKNPIVQNTREQINKIVDMPGMLLTIVDYVITFALLVILFAMIYKILPEAEIDWSDVWIGATVTAFLFLIVQLIVAFNAKNSGIQNALGAIGSMTVLYLWIFYSSIIFLFGAEFTKIYAKRYGTFREERNK